MWGIDMSMLGLRPPIQQPEWAVKTKSGAEPIVFDAREPRRCVICNTLFSPRTAQHVTCSDHCRGEHSRQRKAAARAVQILKEPKTRKCVECGATFTTRNGNKITCSPECMKNHRNRRQLARYHKRKTPEAEKPRVCVVCGKTYFIKFHMSKTCGPECKEVHRIRTKQRCARERRERIRLSHANGAA